MESKGSGFIGILINMFVILALGVILIVIANANATLPGDIASQQHEQAMAELQKSDLQVAIEAQGDTTKAGYAAIVAVAASADISQTKIAQAIPNSLWAVAIIIVAVVVGMYLIMNNPKRKVAREQTQLFANNKGKHFLTKQDVDNYIYTSDRSEVPDESEWVGRL